MPTGSRHHVARVVGTDVHPCEAQEQADDDADGDAGSNGARDPPPVCRYRGEAAGHDLPAAPRAPTEHQESREGVGTGDDRVVRGTRVVVGLRHEDHGVGMGGMGAYLLGGVRTELLEDFAERVDEACERP